MDFHFRVRELETALSEECNSSMVYGICQGQSVPEELRAEVWKACLGVKDCTKHIIFDEIFDLPEQNTLREDCQQFVDKLGNEDEDKVSVLCDLESILTHHRRSLGPLAHYTRGNGWVELLLPLIALKLPRDQTCALFQAVVKKYIPCNKNIFHLFRLLLLYHDPQLCNFLDTRRITPDKYATPWFQSLFAATCSLPVVTAMWDLYFQKDDCFFLMFLGLVMVVNAREQILEMGQEEKDKIAAAVGTLPCGLEPEDVEDFCSLAQYYCNRTPTSFREELETSLFGLPEGEGESDSKIAQALCLPVSVAELIENTSLLELTEDTPRFFLVDCRPADQYNAGHLATAFHLDCNLMLQEPVGFATAVQGLLSCQRQAIAAGSNAGGEHLCFLGCGRLDDDQYTHMVVASFLQKHTQYISLLTGGYQAIHQYLGERVNATLVDHNPSCCHECCVSNSLEMSHQNGSTSSSSSDLFGKIGAAMKLKSAEVKDKLLEYIVNPSGGNPAASDRHVSASDKLGKRYRNMAPVFSIDDELDTPDIETENHVLEDMATLETVSLSAWLKKPEVVASFKCQEVNLSGYMYESHLLVTPTHVYVLRETAKKKDSAQIVVKRPLSNIAKITCKKKQPDLITFKYGRQQGDNLVISDMDRFLIPQAAQATRIISDQILKNLQDSTKDGVNT
ncbi:TBC1 domain family member 23 isoform X2 [Macrosteles quadrilineatus]|uniref:TBC1 domain family member 23 isoform X2 n=1 Tax=Macrosteles quadrilineatus TaxID=74068 RepID=UPI0023E348B9|nr:TBC1 domain family member 23 isoform X2 [Macrosteles quadrilineatus]